MFSFLCRTIGIWFFAAAIVAGAVDGMKSIASNHLVLTSLGKIWSDLSPSTLALAQGAVQRYASQLWDPYIQTALGIPGWGASLIVGSLFVLLGTRRRRTVIYVT